MKKSNAALLIITSVMCLLPLILSLVLYSELPEQIAIHWDNAGNPDNFIPKAFAAFGLPFLFLAVNLYSKLRLYNDPMRSKNDHSTAVQMFSTWTPPLLSLVLVPITLFIAMGANISVSVIIPTFTGFTFILCGNYLPKCRQNYTIGIKLPWTLSNANNWNKTHRLAGYLWMLGGVLLIAGTFLFTNSTVMGIPMTALLVVLLVVTPVLYSYGLYVKFSKRTDS